MEIKIDQYGIDHTARHLMNAPELGSKFNVRITDSKSFLEKLAGYLNTKLKPEDIVWIHKEKVNVYLGEVHLIADTELKKLIGIPKNEFLGYMGVIEIDDNSRSKVFRQKRGQGEDDQMEVNVIEGIEPQPSDELQVHLKKYSEKEGIYLVNAYTGPKGDGPGLPNHKYQTDEEFKLAEEYWSKRAFIKW